jgi:hypothetical protein
MDVADKPRIGDMEKELARTTNNPFVNTGK